MSDVINITIEESSENVSFDITNNCDEISIDIMQLNEVVNINIAEVGIKGDTVESEHLIFNTLPNLP